MVIYSLALVNFLQFPVGFFFFFLLLFLVFGIRIIFALCFRRATPREVCFLTEPLGAPARG